MEKTLRFTFALAILLTSSLFGGASALAKESKYRIEKEAPKARLINGFGVGGDLVGLAMKGMNARFANMEALARLNILEKYFPVVELGIGNCNREGNEQSTTFKTTAPYFRLGMDYNLTKKRNGNRLLVGLRYAFSTFTYEYANPDFKDDVYGGEQPLNFTDLKGKKHWLEACVGVETKLWSIVRLGFNIRYKMGLYGDYSEHGDPWYAPGFGKNKSTTWGGSVNLMFDI